MWRTEALELPERLAALNADGDSLREAMFVVWSVLATGSTTVKHLYSIVPESDILALAEMRDPREGNFGLAFEGTETTGEIVMQLGACLRAMELEFSTWDLGARPTDPEVWRVDAEGKSAYLVPIGRKAWRKSKDPASDNRPFDQRGVLQVRFIPTVVDGAVVRLKMADHLSKAAKPKFGAVVFPNADFRCHETPTTFVVETVNIPGAPKIISDACMSAHADDCLAAVFPELTIDPHSRDLIQEQLSKKPWLSKSELPKSPGIVVAGSWHEVDDAGIHNVATVFDGHGEELCRHRKRHAYKDPVGRFEKIVPGSEFTVLVLPDALIAFGICLDFCNHAFQTPYGELDVDFVIVPSCGDDKTMASHIRTARDLHDSRKTRSFVVQQAYPPVPPAFGFVLNPDGNAGNWTSQGLLVTHSWTVFGC